MKVCGHGPCGICCTCGHIVRGSSDVLPDGYPLGLGDTGFPESLPVYADPTPDEALPAPVAWIGIAVE